MSRAKKLVVVIFSIYPGAERFSRARKTAKSEVQWSGLHQYMA